MIALMSFLYGSLLSEKTTDDAAGVQSVLSYSAQTTGEVKSAETTETSEPTPEPTINTVKPTKTPAKTTEPRKGYVSASSLNLRATSSSTSSIMASYPYGTSIQILKDCGAWSYVKVDGQFGYMHNDYIKYGSAPKTTSSSSKTYSSAVSGVSGAVSYTYKTPKPTITPQPTVAVGYTVYVTNTGSKYHRYGCSYLKSCNSIDINSAIARGYTPCSRCDP